MRHFLTKLAKKFGISTLLDSKYKRILWSRPLLYSFLFLVISQLIMASSNVWFANFATAATTGAHDSVLFYLFLSLGTLFLSSIPDTASKFYLNKSKLNALNKYNDEIEQTFKNKPSYTTDPLIRKEMEPWLTSEAEKTIDGCFETQIHIYSLMA